MENNNINNNDNNKTMVYIAIESIDNTHHGPFINIQQATAYFNNMNYKVEPRHDLFLFEHVLGKPTAELYLHYNRSFTYTKRYGFELCDSNEETPKIKN